MQDETKTLCLLDSDIGMFKIGESTLQREGKLFSTNCSIKKALAFW